jgi:hypothetical protein
MRFMSLFFAETNRNMVTPQSNRRDVPVQFQGRPLSEGQLGAEPGFLETTAQRTGKAICL